MILSIDIGGTYTKYGYVIDDNVMDKGKWATEFNFTRLCERIDALVTPEVTGIAISSGGFWEDSGKSIGYESIKDTADNNLVAYLKNKHKIAVNILNDARCALLCEKEYGVFKNADNAVMIVLGTSVGCALMFGGKLYKGKRKKAGMLFKMPENLSPYIYEENANTVKLAKKYFEQNNLPVQTFREIEDLAISGNEEAVDIIDAYSKAVALKLFYTKLMYDPEIIAVGGGISNSEYIVSHIKNTYQNLLSDYEEPNDTPIVKSAYGQDSNLIGASIWFNNFEQNKPAK